MSLHFSHLCQERENYNMNVEHEVQLLVQEIKRLGSPGADGKVTVKFGVLFADDRCANIFEGEETSKTAPL